MSDMSLIKTLIEYSDWSDSTLLNSSAEATDEQLDRDMQIGPGTLRRTLIHIYNGEAVWFERWKGNTETPWPSESQKISVSEIRDNFKRCWQERDTFLAKLDSAKLDNVQIYRDSKGNLYKAKLLDMLLQGFLHSKHHQAQAVNILRRLNLPFPELDYMYRLRKAA